MAETDDFAAYQAWKAQQKAVVEPVEKTLTEELKNWFEGVARHLSHPLPEKVVADMDEKIASEQNETPAIASEQNETPAPAADDNSKKDTAKLFTQ